MISVAETKSAPSGKRGHLLRHSIRSVCWRRAFTCLSEWGKQFDHGYKI